VSQKEKQKKTWKWFTIFQRHFDSVLAQALSVEASKALEKAETHVVVFCSSKLFDMSISCNLIVLISDERGPETERQENVPPPFFFVVRFC
jgi:hypothetical protein